MTDEKVNKWLTSNLYLLREPPKALLEDSFSRDILIWPSSVMRCEMGRDGCLRKV